LGTLVEGVANIGVVNFQKELNFQKDFYLQVLSKLVSFVVTLIFAFTLRNYWALVCGLLVGSVSSTVLTYLMQPFRPLPSLRRWREILNFSKWLQVQNILSFAYRRT